MKRIKPLPNPRRKLEPGWHPHWRDEVTDWAVSVVDKINEVIERISNMATQDDVNAITTELTGVKDSIAATQGTIQSVHDKLQAEIDQLAATHPTLDTTNLKAIADELGPAVNDLSTHISALGDITPTPAPASEGGGTTES